MSKQEWRTQHRALQSAILGLDQDITKSLDSLHLGYRFRDDDSSSQHARERVADARRQLSELQEQVQAQGQSSAVFIAALSAQIAAFAQQLNAIKAQQRSEYRGLLQREQQLQDELWPLQLCWLEEPCAAPASADPRRTSSAGLQEQQQAALAAAAAADCMCRSPDRASSPRKVGGSSGGGCLPPEVQAYDAYLERHGATGGWHPDDHATFAKVLAAHRGDYHAALAVAVEALPLHDRASVITHCRWHADLSELDMRRRIALINWRTARDAAKAAWRAQAAALGDAGSGGSEAAQQAASADQQSKEVRQAKQEQLLQWKRAQQQAAQAAAQAAEAQRRQHQEQQRQRLQQRREHLRQQLEASRAERQQQAAAAAATEAEDSRAVAPLDPAQQQRLRQRNAAALQRQRELLAAKQAREAARELRQEQLRAAAQASRPPIERDPSRLLAATATAAARAAAAAEEGRAVGASGSGFVLHVQRKAAPAWLAGAQ